MNSSTNIWTNGIKIDGNYEHIFFLDYGIPWNYAIQQYKFAAQIVELYIFIDLDYTSFCLTGWIAHAHTNSLLLIFYCS